ncbi:MAG: DUF2062 domain-containing protein [Shimia sp.]
MVFKRRDRRPWVTALREALWPRGGWVRAYEYVKHRVRRLPDSPERIARGIAAGVFTTFTPFYGLHFVVAALLALILRGNVLAAILATFFGNPLTYVPIIATSLHTGYWLLGIRPRDDMEEGVLSKFARVWGELWDNAKALFAGTPRDWTRVAEFWHDIFFPFLVGGIIPGILAGIIMFWLSLPVIRAYQNRRKGRLKERIEALRAKAAAKIEEGKAK